MDSLLNMEPPSWTGPELAWLVSHDNIGPVRAIEVARMVPNPANFAASWTNIRGSKPWMKAVPATHPTPAQVAPGVECIGFFDPEYPQQLRSIPNPPAVLWVRGTLPDWSRTIAVVGTRNPDEWGAAVAAFAARWATTNHAVVVSGLALGCDRIAHEEALAGNGVTVAVLGGQLLSPSPASNRPLADEILSSGGALLSEATPHTQVSAQTLVQRNRIQSGLSRATVVAQTGIPGGTLHTARFTLEQERTLIVGKPRGEYALSARSAGSVALTNPGPLQPEAVERLLRSSKTTSRRLALRPMLADEAPLDRQELFDILDRVVS